MNAAFHRLLCRLRPATRHLGPLAILSLLHIAVVERNLRGSSGLPMNVIPYDFSDTYARFLMFISDSLHAGSWPIWYPYGNAGTPFLLNPQSQLWNPVTWLLSIPGYTLLLAQWQVFLTLLFGSWGTYFLACSLWNKRSAALLAAIAFNFTSARLLNAEHIDIIAAFSLFPWIFWAIERTARGHAWAVPMLGMFLGWLVVSGYPGVVLLSPLWFGAWAIWTGVTDCSDSASRKRFSWRFCLALALALGISAGYWLPVATDLGAFSRGAPLPTDAALAESLSAGDLWHLVYGTPVNLVPSGVTTDVSMRGLYFGVLALLLAVYAVVASRSRIVTAIAVAFVLALLMSMGKWFFLRVTLQDYVSALNRSRFPAGDSRAVAALAGSLLAGGGLSALLDNPDDRRRLSRILVGGIAILLLGLIWLGIAIYPGVAPAVLNEKFSTPVFFELLVLGLALLAVLRFSRPVALTVALLALAGLDSGTHAVRQAGLWSITTPPGFQHFRNDRITDFAPATALGRRIDSAAAALNLDVGANQGFLNKKFYLAMYTPFVVNRFSTLIAHGYRHFLVTGARIVGFVAAPPPSDANAFLQQQVPVTFQISRYLPDRVDYVVDVTAPTTLVFNEIYHPGWKARIDHGKTVAMSEIAGGLRGLAVAPGHHVIETRFSPWTFWAGLFTTFASWLVALAWLARTTVWQRKPRESRAATE